MASLNGVTLGAVPHRSHIHLPGSAGQLGGRSPLLLYVGFDHLSGDARRKLPVLSTFKQDRDYQSRDSAAA